MGESTYIHKSHNVTVLLYHLVCPAKYRKVIFSKEVDESLKGICLEIEKRYEIVFLEIGTDKDHVHFLLQSVPMYSRKQIAQTIKSITAKEVFKKHPEIKKLLWGGEFWSKGYFMSTVGKHGDEKMLKNYVRNQGVDKTYEVLHQGQLKLF
jgi:REP element-mobilizing transposase RayT